MSDKRPPILFATGATYVWPLRAAFGLAHAAGCDGVELDVGPESIWRGPAAIARLAREAGVRVQAVHPPLFGLPGWRREAEMLPRLVDLALAAGARTIVVHPPKATRLDGPLVAEFIAGVAEARGRLAGCGAQIVLENPGFFHPRHAGYPCWHLAGLRRLAEECELSLALDTTHAGSSPCPLLESYAQLRDRLAHVHLSDLATPPRWLDRPWLYSYVKHHQLLGAGHLPLAQFLQGLAVDGFQGDITLELSPLSLEIWRPARALRHLAEAVATTRRLLASP